MYMGCEPPFIGRDGVGVTPCHVIDLCALHHGPSDQTAIERPQINDYDQGRCMDACTKAVEVSGGPT
jgi:hypothetical protein